MAVQTPPTPTTRLILVRHGRTEFNAQGRVQGGGRLDAVGRPQVMALARRLHAEPLAAVYSSPRARTLQTARAIARHHHLPIRQRQILSDISFGIYGGMLFSEARSQDPDLWRQWQERPHTVRFPQGDSLADLRRRMERFLDETRQWHGGRTILAVTHDSPIRILVCLAKGQDDTHHNDPRLVVGVASVTVIELTPDGLRLALHGDTEHLRNIDVT